MNVTSIDRRETFFSNAFLDAYLFGESLSDFFSYKPEIGSIEQAIAARKNYPEEQRKVLVDVLKEQYQQSGIQLNAENATSINIERLKENNTYTITTGQQIHVGLGPVYVLYKIWDTLAIADECRKLHPDSNFVPVFWMATEDHDFEEVQTIKIFGKEFTWENETGGAVGRLSSNGLTELFGKIRDEINLNEKLEAFISLCEKAYSQDNFANATRYIVHELFGEHGLVVVDADHPELKQCFTQVIEDELNGKNAAVLRNTTEELKSAGFEPQIHIRDVNLFHLSDGKRERLDLEKAQQLLGNKTDDADWAYQYSPNVALRPLYQEMLLPNLVYVGGPSEVKYWAQLKGLFDSYELAMPIVKSRTSAIKVNGKKVSDLGGDLSAAFLDEKELVERFSSDNEAEFSHLNKSNENVRNMLNSYNSDFNALFPGYTIDKRIVKLINSLETIDELSHKLIVSENSQNSAIKSIHKLQKGEFSQDLPQERVDHIISHLDLVQEPQNEKYSHFGFKNSQKINVFVMISV
jgi:bacillithiol biosynthesis cysteine-adding enzyme BshC